LSARIEPEGKFILALSILLTIFSEFPDAVVAWDTIDFARLVLLASEDFGAQLIHLIQRPDKDWERSVFPDSGRSERAALLFLSLSLAMNEAMYSEHFGAVLKICRNQIESAIEPLMAAACSSMLDIVKAPIKFGAPLDALIGPMLAALAANAARAPAAVIALPIHLLIQASSASAIHREGSRRTD
jgi:hypothetical protein